MEGEVMRFDLPTVVCISPLTCVPIVIVQLWHLGKYGGPGRMCVCVCECVLEILCY